MTTFSPEQLAELRARGTRPCAPGNHLLPGQSISLEECAWCTIIPTLIEMVTALREERDRLAELLKNTSTFASHDSNLD